MSATAASMSVHHRLSRLRWIAFQLLALALLLSWLPAVQAQGP